MSAIDPRPVPSLRERLIQRNQDRVLEEAPAPIRRTEPPRPVHVPPIAPAPIADDDGFTELGPIRGGVISKPKMAISPSWSASINQMAFVALGGKEGPVEVAIAEDGRFRIRMHPNPNATTSKITLSKCVPRIGQYCRDFGYRSQDYYLEIKGGALYGQLEKDDAQGA